MPFSFLQRLLARPAETRASRTAPLLALAQPGRPLWTPRDGRALAEAGFRRNAVAHRCVRLVAEAVAALPLTLFEGEAEVNAHPLLDLLARPNPRQAGQAFLEALGINLLVSGNAYVEAVLLSGGLRELHLLRPDRVRVVPGPDGWPEAYDYTLGASSVRFRQDVAPLPPILHLTQYDPLDDYYGLPPLAAAQVALDTHNAASAWNKALLDNAARPSGALVYAAEGANLSDEQFRRLKEELETNFQGAANAGRPILLEGGLDWKPLSLTPKDMDFLEARNAAAREIALAFGVPPLLLGLPGDNTRANYAEANRAFWRSTVVPLATRVLQAFCAWLAPLYGPDLRLEPDLDRVEALADEREALWRRVGAAGFLSEDEKRAAVGYGPRPAAEAGAEPEVERRYNPNHDPDTGRFTFGSGDGSSASDRSTEPSAMAGDRRGPPKVQIAGGFTDEDVLMTVQEFVSRNCRSSIRSEIPGQFLDVRIKDVLELAQSGDRQARTCKKLLSEDRFRKSETDDGKNRI